MQKYWKTLLTAVLALSLALCVCGALAAGVGPENPESAESDLSASKTQINLEGNLEDWQQVKKDVMDEYADFQERYAPAVRTLENGVRIQRTPADVDRWNIKFYNSDKRGCTACHTSLADTLANMNDTSGKGGYWLSHPDQRNEMGIELTYLQCLACHKNSIGAGISYRMEMPTMMHAIHGTGTAFEKIGGDCWSCHFVDELTGDFALWDMAKYDVLLGVNMVSNVQGEFSYDQNKLSDSSVMTLTQSYEWALKELAGVKPDPENDGIYDQHTITVSGMVEKEMTWTMRELIETAPSVTDIGTFACEVNGFGGPMIDSFEFTGIPVSWLIEQAGPTGEANCFKNEYWGGPWTFEFMEDFPCYLVYKINGETLTYLQGYPVMLYCMDGFAGGDIKNIMEIRVQHTDDMQYMYTKYHGGKGAYLLDATKTTHHPNVGICNFTEGMIIPVGKPYTFEGYAHAYEFGITSIEFSLDNGETWTSFDTTDSQKGKWLYWNFTFTPEQPGGYVLSVRAFAEDGKTWDYPNRKLFNAE